MQVLVLLPLSGDIIAPFTRPFVPGLVQGFHSAVSRLKAFGEVVPNITLDIVDLAAANRNSDSGIKTLTNAAKEACNNFNLATYSALVSGTSPISNMLYSKECKIQSRFSGPHFLVSFDKDIVRKNRETAIRLIPNYGIEFTSFADLLAKEESSNFLFVSVSDDASENLFDHLRMISTTCAREVRLEKLMLHWQLDQWPADAEIKAMLSSFDFFIIVVYSYQLEKLAGILSSLDCSKRVFLNLDGVDLIDGIVEEKFLRFVENSSPLIHTPLWTLRGSSVTNYRGPEQREVTVRFFDARKRPLDDGAFGISEESLLRKYLAGYAFDTASILLLSEQKRLARPGAQSDNPLSKYDVIGSLPFQGITGTLVVDEAGDLKSPLRIARMRSFRGKLKLDEVEPTQSGQIGDMAGDKHQPSISALIKSIVGSSLVPTRQVCFLDVAYNDQQADRDKIHWVVAAPSVATINEYKKLIKEFGGEYQGYRLGNHPSVLGLLPRLVNRSAVSQEELELLRGSRTPFYRIPQDETELANFRRFIASADTNNANWIVELADYLTGILPQQNAPHPHDAFPEFPGLVATETEDKYSEFAGSAKSEVPPLMDLWDHLCKTVARRRDEVSCFMSCSGDPLRRIYLCTIHFDPREEGTISGYPTDENTLSNYRLAQVYLGIGWKSDDPNGAEKARAEQEALTLLESIRAVLLGHATIERLQKWQRRIGVEDTVDVLGHQFKKLPLAISGKYPNWLCTPEEFTEFAKNRHADFSNYLIAPRPKLLDAFGRLLTFWSFDSDPRALSMEDVSGDFVELTKLAADFASKCELARNFSQRALNNPRDFDEIDAFPTLSVTVADESESLRIRASTFYKKGRPSITEENKPEWRTLAGLLRLLVIICEGAIQYRKMPILFTAESVHIGTISELNNGTVDQQLLDSFAQNGISLASKCVRTVDRGSEWNFIQGSRMFVIRYEDGKLNIFNGSSASVQLCITRDPKLPTDFIVSLTNTCSPKLERAPRSDFRMGMKGDHIKKFICSKFLSQIEARVLDPIDNDNTYQAQFKFSTSKCNWIY